MVSVSFPTLAMEQVERETLNLKVVGSTPTWGAELLVFFLIQKQFRMSLEHFRYI